MQWLTASGTGMQTVAALGTFEEILHPSSWRKSTADSLIGPQCLYSDWLKWEWGWEIRVFDFLPINTNQSKYAEACLYELSFAHVFSSDFYSHTWTYAVCSLAHDRSNWLETSYTTMFRVRVCKQEVKGKSAKPPLRTEAKWQHVCIALFVQFSREI